MGPDFCLQWQSQQPLSQIRQGTRWKTALREMSLACQDPKGISKFIKRLLVTFFLEWSHLYHTPESPACENLHLREKYKRLCKDKNKKKWTDPEELSNMDWSHSHSNVWCSQAGTRAFYFLENVLVINYLCFLNILVFIKFKHDFYFTSLIYMFGNKWFAVKYTYFFQMLILFWNLTFATIILKRSLGSQATNESI